MHFVYIIHSVKHSRQYIGSTDNVVVRLRRHNAGSVRSTKNYQPWKLVRTESFTTKNEAWKRELLLKKSTRLRKEPKQLVASSSNG